MHQEKEKKNGEEGVSYTINSIGIPANRLLLIFAGGGGGGGCYKIHLSLILYRYYGG